MYEKERLIVGTSGAAHARLTALAIETHARTFSVGCVVFLVCCVVFEL
jgi:hypothetical protein